MPPLKAMYHEIYLLWKPQGKRGVRIVDYVTQHGSVQLPVIVVEENGEGTGSTVPQNLRDDFTWFCGHEGINLEVRRYGFKGTNIKAQMASAAPPLGPQLGQRGLNVTNFCKEFNKETGHIKPGVTLPTRVLVKPDRTYTMEICSPATSWLLKQAAGIARGKSNKDEIAGKLSVKHIYEIAKVKSKDKCLVGVPLQEICRQIIKQCRTLGIEVQREDLDPVELKKFLDERRQIKLLRRSTFVIDADVLLVSALTLSPHCYPPTHLRAVDGTGTLLANYSRVKRT
ncbi:hypothetical protein RB195_011632 [Necator americanus]|uniref:Large ribosomal subunit protein uL11m n=1 Tax=Necator americanus TaxID=51031 RepID=A0ABR1D3B7_NECAM